MVGLNWWGNVVENFVEMGHQMKSVHWCSPIEREKNNKELPLKFKYDSTHVVEPGICMFLIIPTSTVKLKAGMARVDYAAVHEC